MGHGVYIRFGCNVRPDPKTCIAIDDDGYLAGIIVDKPCPPPPEDISLGKYFKYTDGQYKRIGQFKTLNNRRDLRNYLYKHGFRCDGIRYVRLKRSAGSARVGKCLFINADLYPQMHRWELCGLKVKYGQKIDLAAFESSIALTTSDIIDTIKIFPRNILVVDDYDSVFFDDVIATESKNGHLYSSEQSIQISNSIWDGESILDESMFGKYSNCGMLLLRNRFFKSCCFQARLQQWFKDNDITKVSQLNGFTLATSIQEIKLITTPNSIKYLKFGTLISWLENIEPVFGIVKHDKPPRYFNGEMVQTHYQLLNTLQMSMDDMQDFLHQSLDFADKLRNDPAVVRYYIKYPQDKRFDMGEIQSSNDVVYNLLGLNDAFAQTQYYGDFLKTLLKSFYKNLKKGHVLVEGNYSTILGNPIELLQQSIGIFKGESILEKGAVHSSRFSYGKNILCCRSPHINAGNIFIAKNTECDMIDKYFCLTPEIICINSIGDNILQRLNGCDFDSDTVLITDNPILLKAAEKNYNIFKTPTSIVKATKKVRYYTSEQLADLDDKTSVNKIGEIVNLSQVLNSLYWDHLASGESFEENESLYNDICTLAVMSGIEIDKAKKEFAVNTTAELNSLKLKYAISLTEPDSGKKVLPFFFSHISKIKGYYSPMRKKYLKHDTAMDYLQSIVNGHRLKSHLPYPAKPLGIILDAGKYREQNTNYIQAEEILRKIDIYARSIRRIRSSYSAVSIKKELCESKKSELESFIATQDIGYSTIYYILNCPTIGKNSTNTFLDILVHTRNRCMLQALTNNSSTETLVCGNSISLYHKTFDRVRYKKSSASTQDFYQNQYLA